MNLKLERTSWILQVKTNAKELASLSCIPKVISKVKILSLELNLAPRTYDSIKRTDTFPLTTQNKHQQIPDLSSGVGMAFYSYPSVMGPEVHRLFLYKRYKCVPMV